MDKVTKVILILFLIAVGFASYFVVTTDTTSATAQVTWPLIIGASIIDSLNPCAIAVMIMLLGFLSSLKKPKNMLMIGAIYISVVYITYLLAGLGLLTGVQQLGIEDIVYNIAAVLAIGFGVINLKDFFMPKVGYSLEIPDRYKPKVREMIEDISIPGAVLLGFFVSLVELPCSGTVYFTILGMLGKTAVFSESLIYLLVYNFFFVLPLIIILLLMYKGLSMKKASEFKESSYRWIRLVMGLLLVALGFAMIFGWI